MAKIVKKEKVKSKNSSELKDLLTSINSAKAELAEIRKQIKRDDQIRSGGNLLVENTMRRVGEEEESLNKIKTKIKDSEELLFSKMDDIDNASLTLAKIKEDIALRAAESKKLEKDRDSYKKSLDSEIKALREDLLVQLFADKTGLESKIFSLKDEQIERTKLLESTERTLDKLNKEIADASATKDSIEKEINNYREELELVKINNKRVIQDSITEMEEFTKNYSKKHRELNNELELAKKGRDAEVDKLNAAINEVEAKRASLRVIKEEHNALVEKNKKELTAIIKKKKEEEDELVKLKTRRFSVMRASKDLKTLYTHIKNMYEKAGVDMPEIELNIE